MVDTFQLYNLLMGLAAVVGLAYLGYSQRFVVSYRRFIYFLFTGFFVFSVGGPLFDLFLPDWTHVVHGVAALFVILGLYDPVHNDLRKTEWAELVVREPAELRNPGERMVPMDDEILELFHTSALVLTPAIIAYNIDRSREEVNRRLTELVEHGLVERVGRGKYCITELGERYLQGEFVVTYPENDGQRSYLTN